MPVTPRFVFISYARLDGEAAATYLSEQLAKAGHHPWRDTEQLLSRGGHLLARQRSPGDGRAILVGNGQVHREGGPVAGPDCAQVVLTKAWRGLSDNLENELKSVRIGASSRGRESRGGHQRGDDREHDGESASHVASVWRRIRR